jgi:hypothetical protein
VAQQARHLAWKLQDGELAARFLIRDRDAKFNASFDEVLRSEAVEVVRTPHDRPGRIRSPSAGSGRRGESAWITC